MNTPFVFGKIAVAEHFTNRKNEIEQLVSNFKSSINTVIISPRRWGKSSLVKKAAEIASKNERNIKFCFIDMFNVRTEEHFYHLLALEVLKATSSKFDEMLENSKHFLTRLIPKLSFSPDSINDVSISLDWEEVQKQPDEILDFAENIAKSKKMKLIICLDEFQNISGFKEPLEFQKKLRSHWQNHQNVAYCLYGSKRHMLLDVFTSQSMPFYKFGDILFLKKITENHWIPFIMERFLSTGKKISENEAELICKLADNHSFYVQQLAHLVWIRTETNCKNELITEAFDTLLLQLSFLYQTITDGLSNTQVYFLDAAMKNEDKLSSKDVIKKYRLGTSSNVNRIKQALINKEIIEIHDGKIFFNDPLYKEWLKRTYFI